MNRLIFILLLVMTWPVLGQRTVMVNNNGQIIAPPEATDTANGLITNIIAGSGVTAHRTNSSVTLSASASDSGGDFINVTNFGAVPDGMTDSTAEIAAAAAVYNSNGGTLYFPGGPGAYLTSNSITLSHDGSVQGDGDGAFISFVSTGNSTLEETSQSNTLIYDTSHVSIAFKNITFYQPSTNATGSLVVLTNHTAWGSPSFDHVAFIGGTNGLYIMDGANIPIWACLFGNQTRYGILNSNEIEQDLGGFIVDGGTAFIQAGVPEEAAIRFYGGNSIVANSLWSALSYPSFTNCIEFDWTGPHVSSFYGTIGLQIQDNQFQGAMGDTILGGTKSFNSNITNFYGYWEGIQIRGNLFDTTLGWTGNGVTVNNTGLSWANGILTVSTASGVNADMFQPVVIAGATSTNYNIATQFATSPAGGTSYSVLMPNNPGTVTNFGTTTYGYQVRWPVHLTNGIGEFSSISDSRVHDVETIGLSLCNLSDVLNWTSSGYIQTDEYENRGFVSETFQPWVQPAGINSGNNHLSAVVAINGVLVVTNFDDSVNSGFNYTHIDRLAVDNSLVANDIFDRNGIYYSLSPYWQAAVSNTPLLAVTSATVKTASATNVAVQLLIPPNQPNLTVSSVQLYGSLRGVPNDHFLTVDGTNIASPYQNPFLNLGTLASPFGNGDFDYGISLVGSGADITNDSTLWQADAGQVLMDVQVPGGNTVARPTNVIPLANINGNGIANVTNLALLNAGNVVATSNMTDAGIVGPAVVTANSSGAFAGKAFTGTNTQYLDGSDNFSTPPSTALPIYNPGMIDTNGSGQIEVKNTPNLTNVALYGSTTGNGGTQGPVLYGNFYVTNVWSNSLTPLQMTDGAGTQTGGSQNWTNWPIDVRSNYVVNVTNSICISNIQGLLPNVLNHCDIYLYTTNITGNAGQVSPVISFFNNPTASGLFSGFTVPKLTSAGSEPPLYRLHLDCYGTNYGTNTALWTFTQPGNVGTYASAGDTLTIGSTGLTNINGIYARPGIYSPYFATLQNSGNSVFSSSTSVSGSYGNFPVGSYSFIGAGAGAGNAAAAFLGGGGTSGAWYFGDYLGSTSGLITTTNVIGAYDQNGQNNTQGIPTAMYPMQSRGNGQAGYTILGYGLTGSSGGSLNPLHPGLMVSPLGVIVGYGDGTAGVTNSLAVTNTITAAQGYISLRSNLVAPTSITFPATGVNWTNPLNVNIEVYIDNPTVTGTSFKKNGTQIFSSVTGDITIHLQPGEYFSETYTVGTPTATYSPF